MNPQACQRLSEFVGVLSNPLRVRILCVLSEGEESVGAIAEAVGLPSPHVSAHLRVLYDRGYVTRRREWKQVFYALCDPDVTRFIDMGARLAAGQRREKGEG